MLFRFPKTPLLLVETCYSLMITLEYETEDPVNPKRTGTFSVYAVDQWYIDGHNLKTSSQHTCYYSLADYSSWTFSSPPSLALGISLVVVLGFFSIVCFGLIFWCSLWTLRQIQEKRYDAKLTKELFKM
eukprot:TRINITY_DN6269_c1_g1_i2.p1 TRINITY_DN6269_c1_g1~~TRINITY_DN6269_c1_g1_i2.p1  ORF type:complete len:129 (+),score=13.78 TRINITY_DN6269_c1_g1_i2:273-659(+)